MRCRVSRRIAMKTDFGNIRQFEPRSKILSRELRMNVSSITSALSEFIDDHIIIMIIHGGGNPLARARCVVYV